MTRASPVLVTGGAGFIGSHLVLELVARGYAPVVLDDLSAGRDWLVPEDVPLVRGNVGDRRLLDATFRDHGIGAVIHLAGSIVVAESVETPLAYYANNVANSTALIAACVAHGIDRLVFSSSAAVYGVLDRVPVAEDAPTRPTSPYGRSKLMVEWVLQDVARAHGLGHVALRYFNVAGADPGGRAGQAGPVATHLIKVASEAAVGRRREVAIYGEDYPTPDGTCLRDYIHVSDLAAIHVAALEDLAVNGENRVLNCGYGHGHSVAEVVAAVKEVSGADFLVRLAERRAGDPPALVADATRLRRLYGWKPRFDDLHLIVRTAIDWERSLAARDAG